MTEEIDLQERFPDLQPIRRAPGLFRLNGFGAGLYGKRDHDDETGSYVKTYCVSALFLPVLALRGYRVVDSDDGGWYFLGRVPLSGTAKLCNLLVLLAALGVTGRTLWAAHTSKPEYKAGRAVAEARELAGAGELGKAARAYARALELSLSVKSDVADGMRELVEKSASAPVEEATLVFRVAVDMHASPLGPPILDDLGARAMRRAEGADDAKAALALLEAVEPVVRDSQAFAGARRGLLERVVEDDPYDLDAASALAADCERAGEIDRCIVLLEPLREMLEDHDGARVLGQAYAARGRYDEAFALLQPYTEARLERLHTAERAYDAEIDRVWRVQVGLLERGLGPRDLYRRIDRAPTEEQRDAIIQEYLTGKVLAHRDVVAKREAMQRAAAVVPVALDLGIVRLRRAQAATDPSARRAELEQAERTFLAIRGVAGETDEYRLFLGQVYYWLGKHEEGKAQLDALLAAHERNPEMLIHVAQVLREVGAASETRKLAEEAHGKAKTRELMYAAAMVRALVATDTDDYLRWLRQCDSRQPFVAARLNNALGHEAHQKGDEEEARRRYRAAIDAYLKMPESSSTLNDAALACSSLYGLGADRADLRRASHLIERALALDPGDAIVIGNAAEIVLEDGLRESLGSELDVEGLRLRASFDLLSWIYVDDRGRKAVVSRALANPRVQRGLALYEKSVVLAPKRTTPYSVLSFAYYMARDTDALRSLARRLRGVTLDLAQVKEATLAYYRGEEEDSGSGLRERSIARLRGLAGENARAAALLAQALRATKDADPDETVRLAEIGHRDAKSSATRSILIESILHRAIRSLPGDFEVALRTLSAEHVFARILSEEGPLRDAALKSDDVKRARALVLEGLEAFPDSPWPVDWAFLRLDRPETAASVAKKMLAHEDGMALREIGRTLWPFSASVAYGGMWERLAAGDDAAARKILADCAAEGVPFPLED